MEGIDPLTSAPVDQFQPGADVSEQVDDDFTDEQAASVRLPASRQAARVCKKLGLRITAELHFQKTSSHRKIFRQCPIEAQQT